MPPALRLTGSELRVLKLVARCCTASDAANRLAISPRTVKVHTSRLMRKLGIHKRTLLVHYAIKHNLVAAGDVLSGVRSVK
jgi:two-component system response regulator NreC